MTTNDLAQQLSAFLDALIALLEQRVNIHPPVWGFVLTFLLWLLSLFHARLDAIRYKGDK